MRDPRLANDHIQSTDERYCPVDGVLAVLGHPAEEQRGVVGHLLRESQVELSEVGRGHRRGSGVQSRGVAGGLQVSCDEEREIYNFNTILCPFQEISITGLVTVHRVGGRGNWKCRRRTKIAGRVAGLS